MTTAPTLPTDTPPRRRILLCVTGMSPQIVTETLYALSVAAAQPWIPDEIWLLTTQRGADNARLLLLSEQPGWFQRLRHDWQLPPIAFDSEHIHVLQDKHGKPMHDIRDDADNESAANGIAAFVQKFTADPNTEIHASIAGGRKTMGFFMGYAMSLWGREQDRLSHVLVSSPFEGRTQFFYPTPYAHVIPAVVPGQDTLDAQTAQVWLGHIPFVRLRGVLPFTTENALHPMGFSETIEAANCALENIHLEIHWRKKTVSLNGQVIKVPPMQLALLCVLVGMRLHGAAPLSAPSRYGHDAEWNQTVHGWLCKTIGEGNIPSALDEHLQSPETNSVDRNPVADMFDQQLSRLKARLKQGGLGLKRDFIVTQTMGPSNRQRVYYVALPAQQLTIITQ